MAKTTFAEEIYLRALTGKVVGEHVLGIYNKVAVISVKNIICSSISAAAEAAFVMKTQGRAAHFIVEEGNAEDVAKEVARFEPNAVILMFGGETPIEETKKLFVETLKALSALDLDADIIVHVRIFAAGGLAEAVKDKDIAEFLNDREVYVYTVDFDGGFIILNDVFLEENGEIVLSKLSEIPVTVEHADLLNRSLRDRTVEWKEM